MSAAASSPSTRHPGILHIYHHSPHLVAFEHLSPPPSNPHVSSSHPPQNIPPQPPRPQNTILFIGGLGDTLLHPHYPSQLTALLPPSWRLVEVLLSSSGDGWTMRGLVRDAEEVGWAIDFFSGGGGGSVEERGKSGKVVLMGHSTGAQICMEYLTARAFVKTREPGWQGQEALSPALPLHHPPISAIILQAGISDREALCSLLPATTLSAATTHAHSLLAASQPLAPVSCAPLTAIFGATPSATRFLSLTTPNGPDDYFSSDLPDSELRETFGKVGAGGWKVLVLLSGEDEWMPGWVDKEMLVGRWERAFREGAAGVGGGEDGWSGESGVLEGAGHALEGVGVVKEISGRIGRFLEGL